MLKKDKYTISDVAEMMGVSRSTISKAINNSPGVGDELRKKVLDFVAEIGYQPNTIARSLSKGSLNIIALILGDVRNPFYSDLAFYIQKTLNNNGYMVMVFNSEYDIKKEIEFIELTVQFNFAGLILLTAQTDEIEKVLKKLDIPIVLVNRILESYDGNSVLLDNFKAGYIATMHLIELGHPKIAFIVGQSTSSASEQRYNGYRQALETYKLPFDEKNVFKSDLKLETGYELAKHYIADIENRPSAIVIVNDMTSLGFMEYCRESNIKIPEMLSIVSFDNIAFSSLYDIQLTTVSQHVCEMSEQAARLMLKQLKQPDAKSERIILDPTLIVRNTTSKYNPKRFETE
ncbi:MAG: LacI family DNA-binding transcriptional regulator [Lachnospiraceae bacterium]|nr:LacI family DNA-binding transcriptional regulator [Lachnospiraceae bacterium]